MNALSGKDLLSILDLTPESAGDLLDLADQVKGTPRAFSTALSGKVMAMIF